MRRGEIPKSIESLKRVPERRSLRFRGVSLEGVLRPEGDAKRKAENL